MDSLLQDIRFGFRQLLKRPIFTALAIVSMAPSKLFRFR